MPKSGPKVAVQERTLAEFVQNLTSDEADDADRYKNLLKVIGEQLSGARVYRFGDVEKDIYLVGKRAGRRLGGTEHEGGRDVKREAPPVSRDAQPRSASGRASSSAAPRG